MMLQLHYITTMLAILAAILDPAAAARPYKPSKRGPAKPQTASLRLKQATRDQITRRESLLTDPLYRRATLSQSADGSCQGSPGAAGGGDAFSVYTNVLLDPDTEYDEAPATESSLGDCLNLCDLDDNCLAFSYTSTLSTDNCLMFTDDTPADYVDGATYNTDWYSGFMYTDCSNSGFTAETGESCCSYYSNYYYDND